MPSHSTSRAADPTPATEVTIRRAVEEDGAIVYIVSDEDSEFARSTLIADALHYASDLLYGPGTGPRGTVWNLLKATELYCPPPRRWCDRCKHTVHTGHCGTATGERTHACDCPGTKTPREEPIGA